VIALTRRYRFPAAHVLRHPALPDAENERIYGKCANPAGHGHDYGIEVTVSGAPDPRTGFLVPPEVLDAIVAERVLARFDHRLLNDDPLFAGARVPTAENIAIAIHGELADEIARRSAARLARVRVVETPRNFFDYEERR
jgi:6-pyruvoyltetrahydropterin/6-carboxytetrahydropterin synthase